MGKKKIDDEILEVVKEFKKKIGAEKIILFGSYATGKTTRDSDVDLILVSKKFRGKNFYSRFRGLWLKWNSDMPVDFIPYTPEEFERLSKQVSIAREALQNGIEM